MTGRTRIALLVVGGASLITALVSVLFGGSVAPRADPGNHAFSSSAVGYQGFVELLSRLDIPAVVSRHDSATKAGDDGVLLLAEPPDMEDVVEPLLDQSSAVVLTLPKWEGERDPKNPSWIASADLTNLGDVTDVLHLVADGTVVRAAEDTTWHVFDSRLPDLSPTLAAAQLIRPTPAAEGLSILPQLDPIVATQSGDILVGEVRRAGAVIWVVSDPDIFNNHGLGDGDNAVLAVGITEALRNGGGVIVDETIHGFQKEPSIWSALLDFPLVLATLQACACILVLLWAFIGRFGAPEAAQVPFAAGADYLIGNTAALLEIGGHGRHTLGRYFRDQVTEVKRELHAPSRLGDSELIAWLDRIGGNRNVSIRLVDLDRQVADMSTGKIRERQTVQIAQRIHQWKQEMLHGSQRR